MMGSGDGSSGGSSRPSAGISYAARGNSGSGSYGRGVGGSMGGGDGAGGGGKDPSKPF